MNTTTIGVIILAIVLLGGGWYAYTHPVAHKDAAQTTENNFGTYHYECDEHVAFSMTPASDMSSIHLAPDNGGAYPPESTLLKTEAGLSAAARYEGNGIVFSATGETVTLGEGDSAINCSPVPSADLAPFNWGDAGAGVLEGGGVKQDLSLIVSESIIGKWQSTEDTKHLAEFQKNGIVIDSAANNKEAVRGSYVIFTKEHPVTASDISFPLESGVAYVQENWAYGETYTDYFKVSKLTPDQLELTSMDSGGTLHFTSVR